jgi:hypothetical protein
MPYDRRQEIAGDVLKRRQMSGPRAKQAECGVNHRRIRRLDCDGFETSSWIFHSKSKGLHQNPKLCNKAELEMRDVTKWAVWVGGKMSVCDLERDTVTGFIRGVTCDDASCPLTPTTLR